MTAGRSSRLRRLAAAVLGAILILVPATSGAGDSSLLERALAVQEKIRSTVERVRPAVVSLAVQAPSEGGGPPRFGSGSGVVVDPKGLVLTNYHVAGWAKEITVIFAGSRRVKARVKGRDPEGDLVLLQLLEPGPWPSVEVSAEDECEPGCWVLAMGNPRGESRDGRATVTLGAVTALHCLGGGSGDRRLYYGDAVQTDAEINPGSSGGPLFSLDGMLVGINGRIATRNRSAGGAVNANVGFAIPASQIRRFLPLLKQGGAVRHGYLGVELEGAAVGNPVVRLVRTGSAAEKGGVKSGDVLLTIDGEEVLTPARLTNLIFSRPAGTRITLRVRRDGAVTTLSFALGHRPEEDE